MTHSHEAAIRAALDELVAALLAVVTEVAAISEAPDRLLDIESASALLGIGRSRLYDEIGAGRLRSIKVGRRRLIPSGAIADFIAADGHEKPARGWHG
jgi:excisionase family DNA binding protein